MMTADELSLVDEAIGFAARAHAGQTRKRSAMPYIAHPVGVAFILLEMGCPSPVVIAGLLHDTVEDTAVSLAEIRRRFGEPVADIVGACSEPQGEPWETRKLAVLNQIGAAPIEVKLVVAADKYHNLYHVRLNQQALGDTVWERFSRGAAQQAWYYRSVVDGVWQDNPHVAEYEIFGRLRSLVSDLFDGIPSQPPDGA